MKVSNLVHQIQKSGSIIRSTLPSGCLSCVEACGAVSEKVTCKFLNEFRRRGKFENEKISTYYCSNDPNLLSSGKMFKTQLNEEGRSGENLLLLRNSLEKEYEVKMKRFMHNVTSLNAHSIQEAYNFISQEDLAKASQDIQFKLTKKAIVDMPDEAAQLFLRILKNNMLMKAEFSVYSKLYDPSPRLDKRRHPIRKVTLNVLHVFFSDFTDKKVFIDIEDFDVTLFFDYESVTVAIMHIVENASKYTLPNSKVYIKFERKDQKVNICFEMISLKIDENEIDKIFDDGYSGRIVRQLSIAGKGMGLFIVKKLLELNGGNIRVSSTSHQIEKGVPYSRNCFYVELPLMATK